MSKQREALELALKAIAAIELTDDFELAMKASRAIREALAEPEKTNQCGETCERAKLCAICASGVSNNEPLTDDEIDNLELPPNGCTMRELVRVVERAHGIGA